MNQIISKIFISSSSVQLSQKSTERTKKSGNGLSCLKRKLSERYPFHMLRQTDAHESNSILFENDLSVYHCLMCEHNAISSNTCYYLFYSLLSYLECRYSDQTIKKREETRSQLLLNIHSHSTPYEENAPDQIMTMGGNVINSEFEKEESKLLQNKIENREHSEMIQDTSPIIPPLVTNKEVRQ